jgi:hypothetical protein
LNLTPEDLRRRGRHPALGGVTLSQLLATWAAHDLTHLHQISRIMRTSVGRPWVRGAPIWACCAAKATAPDASIFPLLCAGRAEASQLCESSVTGIR